MDETDLIVFAKWIDDKMYWHRLGIFDDDMIKFYKKNKEQIRNHYLK